MLQRIAILGTGLIGASTGRALLQAGFDGQITGWDARAEEAQAALSLGALTHLADDPITAARNSDLILLGGPVASILDWMEKLHRVLIPGQLLTDVGSTKALITQTSVQLYNQAGSATFLPGHPMAGKEVSGAANADAALFQEAVWLFTPAGSALEQPLAREWLSWVERIGARPLLLDPDRHDELCAWVSHLPQMLATALSAELEERFGNATDMRAIGGRALREMTRLGSSPFSMWRDVASSNATNIAASLLALEQRIAHLRENLRTPELRTEFDLANRFKLPPKL